MRIDELHWSELKEMNKSPAHFVAAMQRGRSRDGGTPSQAFGLLTHAMTLGGDYVVYEGERRGKAWAKFKAAHPDMLIATEKEEERAGLISRKVLAHPFAAPLLAGAHEMKWTGELFGRICGGTIDAYNEETGVLCELKTASSTQPERFKKAAKWYGYHGQLAWYRDALRAMGKPVRKVAIVGVESSAPYAVTVLVLTERLLSMGERLNRLWLEQLATCEASNEWPEYAQSEVTWDEEEDEPELVFDEEEGAEAAQ